MRPLLFAFVLVAALAGLAATPALALDDGAAFGKHVAEMSPEHPQDHGVLFGECVELLATTGECPHHE